MAAPYLDFVKLERQAGEDILLSQPMNSAITQADFKEQAFRSSLMKLPPTLTFNSKVKSVAPAEDGRVCLAYDRVGVCVSQSLLDSSDPARVLRLERSLINSLTKTVEQMLMSSLISTPTRQLSWRLIHTRWGSYLVETQSFGK